MTLPIEDLPCQGLLRRQTPELVIARLHRPWQSDEVVARAELVAIPCVPLALLGTRLRFAREDHL